MAPNVKDVTLDEVSQNDEETFAVRPARGAGKPYDVGNSSPNLLPIMSGGCVATINGRRVPFASEADAEDAGVALSEMRGGTSVRELKAGLNRDGGSGDPFLRGGADAVEAITGFLRGRKLRQRRDELRHALRISTAERDKRAGLID